VVQQADAQLRYWRERWPALSIFVNVNAMTSHAFVALDAVRREANHNTKPVHNVNTSAATVIPELQSSAAAVQALQLPKHFNAGHLDHIQVGVRCLANPYDSYRQVHTVKLRHVFSMIDTSSNILKNTVGQIRDLVQASQSIGQAVIAVGIDSPRELGILIASGCTYGQGFVLSKALTADEATFYLERSVK
jgi:EAL domain-containing protein (putative c-di-GMP-specific phosphodiesterase class I)